MIFPQPRCKATPSEDFPHTSRSTLRTPHFISSQSMWALLTSYLSFFHLIPSLLTCHQSKLNCFHLIRALINLSHLLGVVLSSSQVLHARKPVLSERCLLHKKNIGRRTFLHTDTWDTDAFTYKTLSEILCTTKLAQRTSQYYFVIQSLHKLLPSTTVYYKTCTKHVPSTTLYYKVCTKYVPVLLCTTKLAQSTFQVLLCTTKLAQSTSQYDFVLQSLHKARPSTLYYEACTKHFPVRLCTTKLAQSTSQYYSVLQSLHKVFPTTTLYYKTCTKHFPVLHISQYYFVIQSLQ